MALPADDPDSPLIDIHAVSKSFGAKAVLREVSWQARCGEIAGLLGPNGAGKTTLFRLLMGILKPDSGSLTVAGRDAFMDAVALKRVIGYLPDEPIFYNYLRGREVLELSAAMHDLTAAEAAERLDPLAERLGIAPHLGDYAEEYSRGMKKKLGLMLALLHRPALVILDEPTNGLDVATTRIFFELMRELADGGTTVVFSTHLLDQVERLCERVAIIHRGEIARQGTVDEVRGGRSLEDVFCEWTRD